MILTHSPRLYKWLALVCFIIAALLIIAVGLPSRYDYTQIGVLNGQRVAAEIGAIAPPIDFIAPNGQPVTFIPEATAVTIINFWATWCIPCEIEMPALQELHERYAKRGLRVIGVNLGESGAAIQAWSARLGLTFSLVVDPQGRAATDYRLRGQPTTVIVASDGRIVSIVYGAADLAALERLIIPLLREG